MDAPPAAHPGEPDPSGADENAADPELSTELSPELSLELDADVRARLAAEPPVGPLPADVQTRITAALAAEQTARETDVADRWSAHLATLPPVGPLPADVESRIVAALAAEQTARGTAAVETVETVETTETAAGATVTPFVRPARRRPRWVVAAAAVAGVAAAAVVGTVVVRTLGPTTPDTVTGAVHVEVSTDRYGAAGFATQARRLLETPGTGVSGDGSGPLATEAGVESCVRGLDVSDVTSVAVDLATFDGRPAAILVLTASGGRTTAYAVSRTCSEADPGIIQGGVTVP